MVGSQPPLRADARRNRDRLLDAARGAFRHGGETVQLADVARAAGVGVGTVYRHFPTREALLETLAREHFEDLMLIAARSAEIDDPFEALGVLLRDMLDQQLGQHGMSAVLTATVDAQAETTRAKARLDAAVTTVLTRAQRAGRARTDVTAADLRHLICGIELAQDRRDPAAREHAYRHLAVVLAGLRRA
jgi:AcrR family transcriptional regulator